MTDKEISELRRRIAPDKHNISRLCGRYVNANRETVCEFAETFGLMPEDASEMYLSLLRRVLSGTNGRNLIDIAFSIGQVETGEEHALLQALRKSGLRDDESVKKLFDRIASQLISETGSLILLAYDSYDVPIKRRDEGGSDESDTMFSYIICAVCPVKESKPVLGYDAGPKTFSVHSCDWNVCAPESGFLFPAFDDRKANIYNALYYTKNLSDSNEELAKALFNTELPLPAAEQKELFGNILASSLGDECSLEVVQTIHDDIAQKIDEHKSMRIPEPLTISKKDVSGILAGCGVSDEKIAEFEQNCDESYGVGADLSPRNLIEPKQFELKTSEIMIKAKPELGDLIETRVIDGVKYVLIRADEEITVNGVPIAVKADADKAE